MNACTRRALSVVLTVLVAPNMAVAQQVTASAPLPYQDKSAHKFLFFGDIVVGIDYGGKVTKDARVNAYSLSQQKLLWRQQDIESSHFQYDEYNMQTPDYGEKVLYIGNGPFAALDVTTGTVRWRKDCDEAGFIDRSTILSIGATGLLIIGSDKCKWRSQGDNIIKNLDQDKKVMLLNRATGQVKWTHKSKPRTKTPGKFWGGDYMFNQSFSLVPVASQGGFHYSTGDDVVRLLVVGDKLEAVNFADGTLLWQTKDDVGSPVGLAGGFLFFVKDDHLNAFALGGNGTPTWSTPIHASSANVLVKTAQNAESTKPFEPNDLFVSTDDALYRLDLPTGAVHWTLKTGGNWQLRDSLLYVEGENDVVAVDFASGTPKWDAKAGKSLVWAASVSSGGSRVALFVDQGKYDKKKDEFVGPYRFSSVDVTSGKVVWSLNDLDGKEITEYGLFAEGAQLRVWGENTVKCRTLTSADGKPAAGPPGPDDRSVHYFKDDKTLRAQNWACDVVWERKGELTDDGYALWRNRGLAILPLKSGTVEIIKLTDGTSLWKGDVGGEPDVWWTDEDRHGIAIHRGDKVTLLHVTS